MEILFVGQSAIRIELDTRLSFEELNTAVSISIKYTKTDGTEGSFPASVDTEEEGVIYYDILTTSQLDQSGTWLFWTYVILEDTRIGKGTPAKLKIYTEGELI